MATRRVVRVGIQDSVAPRGRVQPLDVAASRDLQRRRGIARSSELVKLIEEIDVTSDPQAIAAIMDHISQDYEDRNGGQLLGLFGRCFLGDPFIDHHIDLSGSIIQHFSRVQAPPGPFASARPYVRNSAYVFVEVYSDGAVVPVRADGTPVL